eukprot:7200903-Prorocentrum_lima.AAC.1
MLRGRGKPKNLAGIEVSRLHWVVVASHCGRDSSGKRETQGPLAECRTCGWFRPRQGPEPGRRHLSVRHGP